MVPKSYFLVDWHENRESVFHISFYITDWGSGPPKNLQKSYQTLAKRLLKTKVSSKRRTLDQKCAFGTILNRFRLPLAVFGRPLGAFGHPFGTPNRYFWPLERSKGLLEALWEDFEHIVAPFGSFWDDFTAIFVPKCSFHPSKCYSNLDSFLHCHILNIMRKIW